MFKTVPAFDRIGEENAFAVLARANARSPYSLLPIRSSPPCHALRTIAGVRCLIEGAPTCCIMA